MSLRSPGLLALGFLVGSLAGPPLLYAQESTNAPSAMPQGEAELVAVAYFEALAVGSVVNGDSLTHVVYADRVFRAPHDFPSSVFLVTLRRTDAGWRVATPYLNLFGFGSVVSLTDLHPADTLPPP